MAIAAINFISCDDEDNNDNDVVTPTNNNSNGGSTTSTLSAEFVSASNCLRNSLDVTRADVDEEVYPLTLSYKYDSSKGEVELTLYNMELNCAGNAKMELSFSGDTIFVGATSDFGARCFCDFDVTSKVKGVQSKVYYICPVNTRDAEEIKAIELSQKEEGSFVYTNFDEFRKMSSNDGSTTPALSGEFISASDCLGSPWDFNETRSVMFDDQAIVYKFDADKGELDLKFEHAELTCSAQAHVDFSFNGDTIFYSIYDASTSGFSTNCICVFDIESKITGGLPKVYYIRPLVLFDEEQIKVLELSQKSEGKL